MTHSVTDKPAAELAGAASGSGFDLEAAFELTVVLRCYCLTQHCCSDHPSFACYSSFQSFVS